LPFVISRQSILILSTRALHSGYGMFPNEVHDKHGGIMEVV